MRILRDKYNCQVPTTFEELLALPGVGRKSANLIMGDVFGKPAIVTDTHCIRLCNRIGLVDNVKEPQKVEMLLWQIIPPEEGSDLCHRFVLHGRAVCDARKPACDRCCLAGICRTAPRGRRGVRLTCLVIHHTGGAFTMFFSIINVIFSLIVGALAGYVAGRLMGTYPASTLHNIVLGMLGGFVGSFLLGLIGLRATGFVGDFVVSVVGACACIWIARKLAR